MVREIHVKNASIFAMFGSRKINFEIRTSKDSAMGFALNVDGIPWLDVELNGSSIQDVGRPKNAIWPYEAEQLPIFKIKDTKSNGLI